MIYCYIAVDKATGIPVAAGNKKYHLRHKVESKAIDPDKVKFYRVKQYYLKNDVVVELNLEEVLKH